MAAGSEDDAVRTLSATLERFRGDPRLALGLRPDADAAAARQAYFELCKQFHPAKFARYSPATVRLANEVFLAIKRAHELASKPAPAAAPAPGAPPTPRPGPPPASVRLATPPGGSRLAPPPAGLRAAGTPRPLTPPIGVPRVVPPTAPPTPTPRPAPAAPSPSSARDRFDRGLELLRAQKWAEARTIFAALAAEVPADPRYRAYLHYTRGWDAFQLGKPTEARAEWQRALACDPGLGLAKWALESTGVAR